ncbi:MAG: hypothetical protein NT024_03465, partial [Proteobacteria bacterium]|nr:hypothetical protein [Pseudomonadota bacterium]
MGTQARVVVLPQKDAALFPWQVGLNPRKMTKVDLKLDGQNDPILAGIGPQLLHFRTFLEANVFATGPKDAKILLDGLLMKVPEGTGGWICCQLDWRAFFD